MNILYILRDFPKLSETFVLNEIIKLGSLGHKVNIFALFNPNENKIQTGISKYSLLEKTHYSSTIGVSKLKTLKNFLFKLYNNKSLTKKQRKEFFRFYYKKFRQKNQPSLKTLKDMVFHFLMILDIMDIIKDKRIEHIHCHFASNNVDLAYLISQWTGIPYTFTTHSFDIFRFPNPDIKKWAMRAKKVISISEFNREYMHSHFDIPYKNMKVITCSNYLDKLTPVSDYKPNPFKIVTIARLTEKKGYPYLIEACKILKDKNIEFSCEIQGSGPQKSELVKLINENKLKKYIKLGNEMKHEEVLDFIKSGSVFVLPCIRANHNDMDGIPVVLMESMAMEIPTISTNISGIPELIDDSVNGIMVPQKDAAALADAILKIKEDVEFAEKIRKKSREKVADKFDIEKNIKKLVEVFEGDKN